jgi:hypothetical protein
MICHGKPLSFLKLEAGGKNRPTPANSKFTGFDGGGQSLRRGGELVHPIGQKIHGIDVDAATGKRYSVPILGKYLVIIANPANHPTQAHFPGLLLPATIPTIMSDRKDLTGGYFSA